MSKTYIHKELGKWKNGVITDIPRKLGAMFNRHNFDGGRFRRILRGRKSYSEMISKDEDEVVIQKLKNKEKRKFSKRYI